MTKLLAVDGVEIVDDFNTQASQTDVIELSAMQPILPVATIFSPDHASNLSDSESIISSASKQEESRKEKLAGLDMH